MKNKLIGLIFTSLLLFSSCAIKDNTSSTVPDNTSSSDTSSIDTSTSTSTSEENKDYQDIIVAKQGKDNEEYTIQGVVAQFTYNYDGKEGAYIIDKTGSMFVYGPDLIKDAKIGDTVKAKGVIAHYMSEQESSIAATIGYDGLLQLKLDAFEILYDSFSNFPMDSIKEMRIKDVCETDFRENDLTTTVIKTKATIIEEISTGYTNYWFNDLSMADNVYCYSKMSGSDYSYLKEYDGKSYECIIAIHSLRPKDEAWRIVPIQILDEVSITQDDEATFALDRLEKQFLDVYKGSRKIELMLQDEQLLDKATVAYECQNHAITQENGKTYLNIDGSKLGEFTLNIKLTYNSKTYIREVVINVLEKPSYTATPIKDVLALDAEGQEITVEGIYARFTANNQGLYLIDDTGIITVNYMSINLEDYQVGETMVFKGTLKRSFAIDGGIYDGRNILINAELIYNDGQAKEWNKELVKGVETLENLSKNPSVDMIGNIYQVRGKIVKVDAGFYTTMKIEDENNSKISMSIYCSDASQLSWLFAYDNQVVDCYMFIRDSKTGSTLRIEILDIIK